MIVDILIGVMIAGLVVWIVCVACATWYEIGRRKRSERVVSVTFAVKDYEWLLKCARHCAVEYADLMYHDLLASHPSLTRDERYEMVAAKPEVRSMNDTIAKLEKVIQHATKGASDGPTANP